MIAILESVTTKSKIANGAMILLLIVLVWVINRATYSPLMILYVLPIVYASWVADRWIVTVTAGLIATIWLVSANEGTDRHYLFRFWDAVAGFGINLFVGYFVSTLKTALEKERSAARMDSLTGAGNWRFFREIAEKEIRRAERFGYPVSMVYMDVDDFKLVNDQYGHSVGNLALQKIAKTLGENMRQFESVARVGGDEFAVLLPQTTEELARLFSERIRDKLKEMVASEGWRLTFSLGVVTFARIPETVDEMLRQADSAMYQVKKKSKDDIRHEVHPKREAVGSVTS